MTMTNPKEKVKFLKFAINFKNLAFSLGFVIFIINFKAIVDWEKNKIPYFWKKSFGKKANKILMTIHFLFDYLFLSVAASKTMFSYLNVICNIHLYNDLMLRYLLNKIVQWNFKRDTDVLFRMKKYNKFSLFYH